MRYLKTFLKIICLPKTVIFVLTSSDIVYSMAAYKVEVLHNTPIYWNTSLTEVHQSRHSIYVEFWIYTEFKNIRTSSKMKGRKIYVVGVKSLGMAMRLNLRIRCA